MLVASQNVWQGTLYIINIGPIKAYTYMLKRVITAESCFFLSLFGTYPPKSAEYAIKEKGSLQGYVN